MAIPARKTPTKKFTRVKNMEFDKDGSVQDRLSKQFTVNYDDGSFGFLFYADEGVTWAGLEEAKQDRVRVMAGRGTGKSTFATEFNSFIAQLHAKADVEAEAMAAIDDWFDGQAGENA